MLKYILSTFILLLASQNTVYAQLAMGKWRTHLAYSSVSQIAQSENKIFAVSEGALFSVDKDSEEMEFYSKLSGLNDANVSRIEYDPTSKQLLIVYNNGNVDLLSSGGVINIPDLYLKQMSASKSVNQIKFQGDKAYLACDFGIVVLNMKKREVADTYYIGPNGSEVKVLNTTTHNSNIYALSANTLYKASETEPNLVNYQFWKTEQNLPGSGELQSISSFAGKLLLLRGNKLHSQNEDGSWTNELTDMFISYLNVKKNKIYLVHNNSEVYEVDQNFNKKQYVGIEKIEDAEYAEENQLSWFAGGSSGVMSYRFVENSDPETKSYIPDGPAVNTSWKMTFSGNKLFVVAGGRWSAEYLREGMVMIFEDGIWKNIFGRDIKEITGRFVNDFVNVAVDPLDDKHFYVTSYGNGLFEFKNDEYFDWHHHLNSTLETVSNSNPYLYIRIDGAVFDKDGNLFMVNSGAGSAIKILDKNGVWNELTFTEATKATMGDIVISNQNQNQKWIASVRYKPGIFIYDDNGTVTDQRDDVSRFISSFPNADIEGSYISPLNIMCLAQDKNGVIWAGTEQGPLLFYNTNKAFDADFTCSRVKIPRNDGTGQADYLLESDRVKAIAIDGANRKWIGTETSGVYLMSENGQETIEHFTTSNSPLLSNDILSIGISPVTGEVFIGTGKGLVSYQSDALDADNTFNNVHAYPNPVRENFNGIITITGLVDNTQVKITDLNGNLVCQTISNGAIATWDGKDVHGRKVNTGIYLVICANEDGTQNTITKIMVIN